MMTTSLTDLLPEIDKIRIRNYILKYGGQCNYPWQNDMNFIEKWLSNWAKSKKKLYRLLGNSFFFTKEIKMPNTEDLLYNKIRDIEYELYDEEDDSSGVYLFYCRTMDLIVDIYSSDLVLFDEIRKCKIDTGIKDTSYYFRISRVNPENMQCFRNFNELFSMERTLEGIAPENIRIRKTLPDGTFELLKINKGEKIGKARGKFLEFFRLFDKSPYYRTQFETYEKLTNEARSLKHQSAILCISIHPMDFMTMSDNNNHWGSCMNWTEDIDGGCYRVGTVEMMNSNMVVCAYLLSTEKKRQNWCYGYYNKDWYSEDYYYQDLPLDATQKEIDRWSWNNKKWRCLFYINKDILCSGK